MKHNNLMNLLTGDRRLPGGWGFPPHVARPGDDTPLRRLLLFMDDEDGHAQLCRWYFSIIRSYPPAWRAIVQSSEGYIPSMFYRPPLESPSLQAVRDPASGAFISEWVVGPSVRQLTGKLTVGQVVTLDLDGSSSVLQTGVDTSGVVQVIWPEYLHLSAGFAELPEGTHTVFFRPRTFNAREITDRITDSGLPDLERCGLLAAYLSLPQVMDKLAIAWLAVARLETEAAWVQ